LIAATTCPARSAIDEAEALAPMLTPSIVREPDMADRVLADNKLDYAAVADRA